MVRNALSLALVGSLFACARSVKIQDPNDLTEDANGVAFETPAPTAAVPAPTDPPVLTDADLATYTPPPTPVPTKATDPPTPAPTNPLASEWVSDGSNVADETTSPLEFFTRIRGCTFTGAVSATVNMPSFATAEEDCARKCSAKKTCGGYHLETDSTAQTAECTTFKNYNKHGGLLSVLTQVTKQDTWTMKHSCSLKRDVGISTCSRDDTMGLNPCTSVAGMTFDSSRGEFQCAGPRCTATECCSACSIDKATTYAKSSTGCKVSQCEVGYVADQNGNACKEAEIYGKDECPANYVFRDTTEFAPMACENTTLAGYCELSVLEAFVYCSSDAGQKAGCCGVQQNRDGMFQAGKCPSTTNTGAKACLKITKACKTNADCTDGESCKDSFCEVVVPPSWSNQALQATPAPTPKMGREQYKIQSNCNFKKFNQIGKKTFSGTDSVVKWTVGSINRCLKYCDNTVGCWGFVLSQDRKQCTITGSPLGTTTATSLEVETNKFGFWCASKLDSWRPKCGQHTCSPGKRNKAAWDRNAECNNDFDYGGETHNCDTTCCADENPLQFLSAGCSNPKDASGNCNDGLRLYSLKLANSTWPPYHGFKDVAVPNEPIQAMEANADLSKAVVAGGNYIYHIDVAAGTLLMTMSGHTKAVVAVDVDWTANKVASASKDGSIRFWDLSTGVQEKIIAGAHTTGKDRDKVMAVTSIVFNDALNIAVSGGKDKWVRKWDLSTNEDTKIGKHNADGGIYALDADFELNYAISGGYDKVLRLFKLNNNMPLIKRIGHDKRYAHDSYIRCVKADFSKKLAISGSYDGTAKIWDLNSYNLIRTLTGHTSAVRTMDVNFDTELIFTASWDKSVRMWNLRSGVHILTTENAHADLIKGIVARADSSTIFCAAWECDCQKLADHYGVDQVMGFGKSTPARARRWFMEQECQESVKECSDYDLDECSAAYCHISDAAVQACTDEAPGPALKPDPVAKKAAKAKAKKENLWFQKLPVVGSVIDKVYDLVQKVPIVGGIVKNMNKKPQSIFEKDPQMFEAMESFVGSVVGGAKIGGGAKQNDEEVSFKQSAEADHDGDEQDAEETPEIDVFNKDQAEHLIDDLKQGMGF